MGSPVALNPSFIAQRRTNVLIKPKKGSFNIDGHDAFKLKEHLFSSKTGNLFTSFPYRSSERAPDEQG